MKSVYLKFEEMYKNAKKNWKTVLRNEIVVVLYKREKKRERRVVEKKSEGYITMECTFRKPKQNHIYLVFRD